MEPGCGLHDPLTGMHELLCDADGGTPRSYGHAEICRANASIRTAERVDGRRERRRSIFGCTPPLAKGANDLRELYVRPFPRCGFRGLHRPSMGSDGRYSQAHVSDSHETT